MNRKIFNKEGLTLFELIIVFWLISLIIYWGDFRGFSRLQDVLETQDIKNFLVDKLNEVKSTAFNNQTLWQDLVNNNFTANKDISRYTVSNNWWWVSTSINTNSKLAYYQSLYLTTNPQDPIDVDRTGRSDPNFFSNWSIHKVQFRQEQYIDSKRRILEPVNISVTSPMLIPDAQSWNKWVWREVFPSYNWYYLTKIVNNTSNVNDCTTPSVWSNIFVVYTTNNLSYKVYLDWTYREDFNYKLCFSPIPSEFNKDEGFWIEFNRRSLNEYFFETIESNK